jgi:hypothetical protein
MTVPTNILKDTGKVMFSLTQNIPDLFELDNAGLRAGYSLSILGHD